MTITSVYVKMKNKKIAKWYNLKVHTQNVHKKWKNSIVIKKFAKGYNLNVLYKKDVEKKKKKLNCN